MPQKSEPRINERYAVVRPLGEGGMGSVCLVRDTLLAGRPIALKFLKPERINSEFRASVSNGLARPS